MPYQQIVDNLKSELGKALADFKEELMKIRSGRLSAGLVEDIKADCFGQQLPLKQLGAISSRSQRELLIQLWDKSYAEGVALAIERADLGLSLRIDGEKVFLTSPPLSEESRQRLIELLNKKKEETFQGLRHLRDKAWREIQDGFQQGAIREDDKFKGRDKLDEAAREHREKLEELTENKETEIKG